LFYLSTLLSEEGNTPDPLERQQVFHKILLFLLAQTQLEELVVMINHVSQCGKASVVIEAAFLMGPESFQRRRSVSSIRGAIRLKLINADFAAVCMFQPGSLNNGGT
jgi:hypothetical protein